MKRIALLAAACSLFTFSVLVAGEDAPREGGDRPKVVRDGQPKDGPRDGGAKDGPRDGQPKDGARDGQPKPAKMPEIVTRLTKAGVQLTDQQEAKIKELNAAREKAITDLNAKFKTQVMDLLTAEQKAKLEQANKEGAPKKEGGDRPMKEGGDRPAKNTDRPKDPNG